MVSLQFGITAISVGDVSGDGVSDVAVAAPFAYADTDCSGRVYVYSGSDGTLLYELKGLSNTALTWTMAPTRDLDLDGTPDILVHTVSVNDHLTDWDESWTLFAGTTGEVIGYGHNPAFWWDHMATELERCGKLKPSADLNGDGIVSLDDLTGLLSVYGSSVEAASYADLVVDGFINSNDLSQLLYGFGTEAPSYLVSAVDTVNKSQPKLNGADPTTRGLYGPTRCTLEQEILIGSFFILLENRWKCMQLGRRQRLPMVRARLSIYWLTVIMTE